MKYHVHFGVYGAVLKNGALLVIKKARGPYTGMFDLPGGSQEENELLEETLGREFEEEVGVRPASAEQLGAFSVRYPYTKAGEEWTLRHVGVLYKVALAGPVLDRPDGLDSFGCLYKPLGELNTQNATPFVLKAVELLSK